MNTSLPQIFLLLNNFIHLLRLDLLIFILLELHHISIELIEAPNRYKVVDLREERALLVLSEQQVLLVQFVLLLVLLGVPKSDLLSDSIS